MEEGDGVIATMVSNATATTPKGHDVSTEILLVASSTVFYLVLFLILKSTLIDKRGILSSKEAVRAEIPQISAVLFAIFVLIGIFMIPIDSYEYSHYVIPLTFGIMVSIVAYELYVLFYPSDGGLAKWKDTDTEDKSRKSSSMSLSLPLPLPSSSKSNGRGGHSFA